MKLQLSSKSQKKRNKSQMLKFQTPLLMSLKIMTLSKIQRMRHQQSVKSQRKARIRQQFQK